MTAHCAYTLFEAVDTPRWILFPSRDEKIKNRLLLVPKLVTIAEVPGADVVVVPMVMEAVAPVGPVAPAGPWGPDDPAEPVAPVGSVAPRSPSIPVGSVGHSGLVDP